MTEKVTLSAIIPVTERLDDVEEVYYAYKRGIEATNQSFEFIYVLDGDYPDALAVLKSLIERGERIKIVTLAKWFGEATALSVGFAQSTGNTILTLSAYLQVEPGEIPKVINGLDGYDMVVARRFPRRDSRFNVIQSKVFHSLTRRLVDAGFNDLGCGVRAFRREIMDEVSVYGDQHRFLPILARSHGFHVVEVDVAQSQKDVFKRVYPFGVYVRRVLDIITIFFLVKFIKKPLRFFGLIGFFTFAVGALATAYLIVERLFFGVGLGDRPAFMLSALVIVLGIQILAVGLIGELIIFSNIKNLKEYSVKRIVN